MTAASSQTSERREHPRYAAPCLAVSIGGTVFETLTWSMGGMMLGNYKGPLSVGSIFKVTGLGKADSETMSDVAIHGRVVRLENDGKNIGFNFLEVDERGYALLQAFMAERMAILNEESAIY